MIEFFDSQPDVEVLESEYLRLLGFPAGHSLDGRARELADWARQWYAAHGKPWIYARGLPVEAAENIVRLNGSLFHSRALNESLRDAAAAEVVVAAVSAGPECEQKAGELWEEGKPDEYFFLEIYGSAVVEHLIAGAGARVCAWAEQNHRAALPHYSPGYSGWDVSEQPALFAALRAGQRPDCLPGELSVLESGMLRPKKSLLAVMGISLEPEKARQFARLVPCESCSFSPCQYRRVPYRYSLPPIEDVRRLQSSAPSSEPFSPASALPLTLDGHYLTHSRALQKWSQDRLNLESRADGSLLARFRYEGTTCSNLGQALEFDYEVKLGPARDGYRVLGARCFPRPGDEGHKSMCEYLSRPEQLIKNIESEKPLLGRPLNDILEWKRPFNPAGCYCQAESRAHKWGLVFEVIHYTLAERERKKQNTT
ncbi:MAG TPA: hypothetical protein VHH88_07400 [Verrucomicrobiae bacterium]|nr:hypothetical protein [Verrucomicrobiae bacterium]